MIKDYLSQLAKPPCTLSDKEIRHELALTNNMDNKCTLSMLALPQTLTLQLPFAFLSRDTVDLPSQFIFAIENVLVAGQAENKLYNPLSFSTLDTGSGYLDIISLFQILHEDIQIIADVLPESSYECHKYTWLDRWPHVQYHLLKITK